jgi:hypothetical protein
MLKADLKKVKDFSSIDEWWCLSSMTKCIRELEIALGSSKKNTGNIDKILDEIGTLALILSSINKK